MTDQSEGPKKGDEKIPEAFPKTTMMPSGWDFSVVPEKKADEDGAANEVIDTSLSQSTRDKMKFPEPDAYPKGWNIADD